MVPHNNPATITWDMHVQADKDIKDNCPTIIIKGWKIKRIIHTDRQCNPF